MVSRTLSDEAEVCWHFIVTLPDNRHLEMAGQAPIVAATAAYDSNSQMQLESVERLYERMVESITAVDRPGQPLFIADFGSATGLNSMKLFARVFTSFRKSSETELFVYHNDLPQNLWSVLFQNSLDSPSSYLTVPKTYLAAVGKSFYERLFPGNFLSLGFTTWSLHWLSSPFPVLGQAKLQADRDPAFMRMLDERSTQDLTKFLAYRAEELMIGGRLLLHMPSSTIPYEIVTDTLQAMADAGRDVTRMQETYPVLMHTVSESVLEACINAQAGKLSLVSLDVVHQHDVYYRQYLQDHDIDLFSTKMTAMIRSLLETSVRASFVALGENSELLTEEFFRAMKGRLTKKPQTVASSEIFAVVQRVK